MEIVFWIIMLVVGVIQVIHSLANALRDKSDPVENEKYLQNDYELNEGCIIPLITIASLISMIMYITTMLG